MVAYPPTATDQFLHKFPGGDVVAHHLGKLSLAFNQWASPPDLIALKENFAAGIAPIAEKLKEIPADQNGRRWKTYVHIVPADLIRNQPTFSADFGHFNQAEERAYLYFQRNGGSSYYPGNGLRWVQVNARSYNISAQAGRGLNGRPIFEGELPNTETNEMDFKKSHRIDAFADYVLNEFVPDTEARTGVTPPGKNAPKPTMIVG